MCESSFPSSRPPPPASTSPGALTPVLTCFRLPRRPLPGTHLSAAPPPRSARLFLQLEPGSLSLWASDSIVPTSGLSAHPSIVLHKELSEFLPCCFPSFFSYFSTLCSQSDLVKACESRCHSSAQPQAPTTTGASVVLMAKVASPCLQPDATAPGITSQPTTFQSLRQATFFPTSEPQTCSALPSA